MLCLCLQNLSLKLSLNISKKAYYGLFQSKNYNEAYYIADFFFLHLPAYDYANDYECYPREEWAAITNVRINIYDVKGSGSNSGRKVRLTVKEKL